MNKCHEAVSAKISAAVQSQPTWGWNIHSVKLGKSDQ